MRTFERMTEISLGNTSREGAQAASLYYFRNADSSEIPPPDYSFFAIVREE